MNSKSEIVIANNRVYHLGLQKDQIADNVFVVGDPARAVRVFAQFDTIEHEVANREFVTFTGTFREMPVSVIGTGIGTDNVEIALVEAFITREFDFETGMRQPDVNPMTVIRIGTSGGVQANIDSGVFAIASHALGLDNTGLYYDVPVADDVTLRIETDAIQILDRSVIPGRRFKGTFSPYASRADPKITAALAWQAKSQGVDFEVGITASSPGFYGPSSRFIAGLKNTLTDIKGQLANIDVDGLRVINMEMESSLLFHLCTQLGYHAGTICPIISAPTKSDKIVDYDALVGSAINIAVEAMYDLHHAHQAN